METKHQSFRQWVVPVLLVLLLLVNALTLVRLWTQPRPVVSVSPPPANPEWQFSRRPARVTQVEGEDSYDCVISYQLGEKLPGSEVVLLYHFAGNEDWQEMPLQKAGFLLYTTQIRVVGDDGIWLRLGEKVAGELVRLELYPDMVRAKECLGK